MITEITITIQPRGAAFGEDEQSQREELSRILRRLALRLDGPGWTIGDHILESNGNRCGTIHLTDKH